MDSWSYPGGALPPLRRTEKLLGALASGKPLVAPTYVIATSMKSRGLVVLILFNILCVVIDYDSCTIVKIDDTHTTLIRYIEACLRAGGWLQDTDRYPSPHRHEHPSNSGCIGFTRIRCGRGQVTGPAVF